MALPLDEQLAQLDDLTIGDLRARWVKLTGRAAPRLGTGLLRLALAYEIQTRALGGLSRGAQQRLTQLAVAKTTTRSAVPGMRLVREWNGVVHIVTVGENGEIEWNGKTWRSLSEVARAITGTRWSGPAFFGLKIMRKAAA
ncbi:MAG: DUF2924 domain-containing protein [Novosphingobium sp.]